MAQALNESVMDDMKLNNTLLTFVTVAGLAASSWATSVSPAGYTNDFSSQPVAADWSFLTMAEAAGNITNAAALDTAMQAGSAAGTTKM